MDQRKRQNIRKRVQVLLAKSDEHFHRSQYQNGKLVLDETVNAEVIEESSKLLADLEAIHRSDNPTSESSGV